MPGRRSVRPTLPPQPTVDGASERLHAVLEAAMDGILTIDERGEIRMVNSATCRMFGYSVNELLGRNVSTLMPEPHRGRHDQYIARFVRTGEPRVIGRSVEQMGRRKDGSEFPIELVVTEIDHLRQFTGVVRDITERKSAEERLQRADRLAALGTLAAGLGHDMHNILLPLRSRLDVIEGTATDAATRRNLAEIRQLVRYLQDLADGLHQLVTEHGHGDRTPPPISLQEWWDHAGVLLRRAISHSVRFTASIEDGLPPIRVARYRLTQAVFNLLINANEALDPTGGAPSGGTIELRARTDPDGTVRLSVRDTGCGMEPEVLRHALDPFFTTKVRRLGTGLGLPIVDTMVRESGGRLEIDSRPGRGTTVTLVFPGAVRHEDAREEATPAPRRAVVFSRDPRQAAVIAALLETHGLDVRSDEGAPGASECVWVTEPGPAVSEYLQRPAPHARVVLLGPPDQRWLSSDCEVVTDPQDFGQLRTTLTRALKGLHDEPAHPPSALRR